MGFPCLCFLISPFLFYPCFWSNWMHSPFLISYWHLKKMYVLQILPSGTNHQAYEFITVIGKMMTAAWLIIQFHCLSLSLSKVNTQGDTLTSKYWWAQAQRCKEETCRKTHSTVQTEINRLKCVYTNVWQLIFMLHGACKLFKKIVFSKLLVTFI